MTTPTHPISEKKLDVAALLEGTTPGPWATLSGGADYAAVIAGIEYPDGGWPVIADIAERTTEGLGHAKARLIAAAPRLAAEHITLTKKVDELEAALRGLMDNPEIDLMLGGNPITIERVVEQARAALNDTTQCRESDNG